MQAFDVSAKASITEIKSKHLTEHFFRYEYAKLVSTLSCRVGINHLESIEDAVQSSLTIALEVWPVSGLPENPSAWLFKVAHNTLMTSLKTTTTHQRILQGNQAAFEGTDKIELSFAGEIKDDLLKMLFACCDESIAPESQLVLSLKILCGFSVEEIAQHLFISKENVYKRFNRGKKKLAKKEQKMEGTNQSVYLNKLFNPVFEEDYFSLRLSSVQKVVYLLFSEGYLSSQNNRPIRQELCREAIRLGMLLVEHPKTNTPQSAALLALMYLHSARLDSRLDTFGGLILLAEQDRTLWNKDTIATGLFWLEKSACGDVFSRFHTEAGIAAEHCLASTFEKTRWDRIVSYYALLEKIRPIAIHRLNYAVAIAQMKGPKAGLTFLHNKLPIQLENSYQAAAVFSDLYQQSAYSKQAKYFKEKALRLAPSESIRRALKRRLNG